MLRRLLLVLSWWVVVVPVVDAQASEPAAPRAVAEAHDAEAARLARRRKRLKIDDRLQPLPRSAPAPADNPTTRAKVELGKQLFFDPRLSGNNTMSCASCHLPERAFGDGIQWNKGETGVTLVRNTLSCLNVGFYDKFFWDGRAATLEQQALGPIESSAEMNQSLDTLERELAAVPGYVDQFRAVFGTRPGRAEIAKALAAFQRTLVAGPSPFDRYLLGDDAALSADARRGLELFQGEARCIECHQGPMLSDGRFHRLGLTAEDRGRAEVTNLRDDLYRIRTPTLRNVADTGPYMHDGTYSSLEAVVTTYYRGVPEATNDGLANEAPDLRGQSFSDVAYLVAFLESLSGEVPRVAPPQLPPRPVDARRPPSAGGGAP